MINWKISKKESELVTLIIERAISDGLRYDDTQSMHMDISACHLNGCPLDLKGLLKAEPFDFAHDIAGIARHINRTNGKIERFFLPRYVRLSRLFD